MNWQTRVIKDWLNETEMSNLLREDVEKLQEGVESKLLVRNSNEINATDYLKNLAVTEFLKNIDWDILVYNPNAWDDYDYE